MPPHLRERTPEEIAEGLGIPLPAARRLLRCLTCGNLFTDVP